MVKAAISAGEWCDSTGSWKGIPYAAPPVGGLRWRVPQPVTPWTGVKETNRFGPSCMQTDNVLNLWYVTLRVVF